jgi:hypothetical protein
MKLRVVVSPGVHKECVPRINTRPKLLVARMPPADDVFWRRRSGNNCVRKDNTREGERERGDERTFPTFLTTYLRTFLPEGPGTSDGGWTGKRFFHSGSSSSPNKPWS